MAWCMSSRFSFVAPWCMAWCMSTIKPRLNGAMRKPGFPCYLPRALAFLAQVEDVLFEDRGMSFHREQRGQGPRSPVPAFTITRPRPRQRAHVLLGKASMPFEQENVGGFTLAGSESTTALISLGALDKEAPRLVVETWPFAPLADSAGVELIACSFIVGHGCISFQDSSLVSHRHADISTRQRSPVSGWHRMKPVS